MILTKLIIFLIRTSVGLGFQGKEKWKAWTELGAMSKQEAESAYIALVNVSAIIIRRTRVAAESLAWLPLK